MRIFLAALVAAFLAASPAAPTFAADRPVGPETGQARHVAEDDRDFGGAPDEGEHPAPFGPYAAPNEIAGGGGYRGQRWNFCPWWFCR